MPFCRHRLATGQSEASIETVNHPLPVPSSISDVNDDDVLSSFFSALIAFSLAFSLAFHVATFVIFPIQVRHASDVIAFFLAVSYPPAIFSNLPHQHVIFFANSLVFRV